MRRIYGLAVAVFITQILLAWRYPGFLTGDEVEVLIEAFRVATGFGTKAWEIRNTFVPDVVVAPLVWIATLAGVSSPAALIVIATIPFALAASATVVLVYRLALRWTAEPPAATAAAVIFALHWLPLGFGSTTYPRVIAMACIVGAALLVTRGTPRAAAIAGVLAGVAFADRYSEIVYLVPLLVIARRQALYVAAGAVASIAVLVGYFDWITRGEWFSSLNQFAQLTLIERDFASRIKHQSPLWYLETLPRWCAPALLPLLWSGRKVRDGWWFVLIPLVALSFVAHKELRYLQGIIPFLAILAGAGFASWWRSRRVLAGSLLAISLVWGLWGLRFLGRESRPAVEAARLLGRDASLRTIAMSQPWAAGGKLYLSDDGVKLIELGTPPQNLALIARESDALAIYESDLTPEVVRSIEAAGLRRVERFHAPRARDVVMFRR